jgi:hypothetical protein
LERATWIYLGPEPGAHGRGGGKEGFVMTGAMGLEGRSQPRMFSININPTPSPAVAKCFAPSPPSPSVFVECVMRGHASLFA